MTFMKNIICSIFICFVSKTFSHDTNKAFFVITQKNNEVVIEAEFPWTIRNAIFQEYPILETVKTQKVFDKIVFEYIKKHFEVFSSGNKPLRLKKVNYIKKGLSHSHQNDYVFVFEGSDFMKIKNTLMFTAFEQQKNHHSLKIDGKSLEFLTDKHTTSFTKRSIPIRNNYWVFILSIGCILTLLILKYKKPYYDI